MTASLDDVPHFHSVRDIAQQVFDRMHDQGFTANRISQYMVHGVTDKETADTQLEKAIGQITSISSQISWDTGKKEKGVTKGKPTTGPFSFECDLYMQLEYGNYCENTLSLKSLLVDVSDEISPLNSDKDKEKDM
jgi:hypothetical protein